MKRKKLLLCMLMVALALTLATSPVQATCERSGHILYSYSIPGIGADEWCYYYIAVINPPDVPSHYTFYHTSSPAFQRILTAAEIANRYVTIEGNAASCPTTGTSRDGGVITKVELKPLG